MVQIQDPGRELVKRMDEIGYNYMKIMENSKHSIADEQKCVSEAARFVSEWRNGTLPKIPTTFAEHEKAAIVLAITLTSSDLSLNKFAADKLTDYLKVPINCSFFYDTVSILYEYRKPVEKMAVVFEKYLESNFETFINLPNLFDSSPSGPKTIAMLLGVSKISDTLINKILDKIIELSAFSNLCEMFPYITLHQLDLVIQKMPKDNLEIANSISSELRDRYENDKSALDILEKAAKLPIVDGHQPAFVHLLQLDPEKAIKISKQFDKKKISEAIVNELEVLPQKADDFVYAAFKSVLDDSKSVQMTDDGTNFVCTAAISLYYLDKNLLVKYLRSSNVSHLSKIKKAILGELERSPTENKDLIDEIKKSLAIPKKN